MAVLYGRTDLREIAPWAADKPCDSCGEPLPEVGGIWYWNLHDGNLVMHMLCFADFERRAGRDRDKCFGVTA